jgi:hypothetical protein
MLALESVKQNPGPVIDPPRRLAPQREVSAERVQIVLALLRLLPFPSLRLAWVADAAARLSSVSSLRV